MRARLIPVCVLTGLLAWGLAGSGLRAAEPTAESAEENTVSLDDAGPKPTSTSTETPTPAPSMTFTPAPEGGPAPVMEPTVVSKLDEPGFDNRTAAEAKEEEGLVLIAPGAASPEESLETFGIDSPFNWKEKRRRARLEPKGEGVSASGEEGIELNAPETSDLREKVAVETGEGRTISKSEDYDTVERAGWVMRREDFAFDATVSREKTGRISFVKGAQFYMQMEPGRQVYPGSVYSVFRDHAKVSGGPDKTELGNLMRAVGVARVIRVDSESILARLEKSYSDVKLGDGLRLRDPDRARHFASLRQNSGDAVGDVRGNVAALENDAPAARAGRFIYLDAGSQKGMQPGLRLTLYREVPSAVPENGLDTRDTMTIGKIGECVVVSVQRSSATARILKSVTSVHVGDKVRFR